MYLRELEFGNYGPIRFANVRPRFREDGSPVPITFVGVNGSGKSILLSFLLDALVSFRNEVFSSATDVEEGTLFKPLKQSIRKNGSSKFAYAKGKFGDNEGVVFLESVSSDPESEKKELPDGLIPPSGFKVISSSNAGLSKGIANLNEQNKQIIRNFVLAYYPANRAEKPGWLGEAEQIKFNISPRYDEVAAYQIWRSEIIDEVSQWIIDVALDAELYDRAPMPFPEGLKVFKTAFIPIQGKNRTIIAHLNSILSQIYSNGIDGYRSARLGISQRNLGRRQIIVYAKNESDEESIVANQLSDLSSGELALLCLFADIIRVAELQGWNRLDLKDIKGIVLIDEVDIHLHIRLQREVLPKLMNLFPGVQFLVTTHSPFFVLGMNEADFDLVNMPNGFSIDPKEFSEFDVAFESLNIDASLSHESLDELKRLHKQANTPLVVTEGNTDWRHLKHALEKCKDAGQFVDLDVEFFEMDEDMGDGELEKCYHAFKKLPQSRPVIFVFDRDNKKIVNRFASSEKQYLSIGKIAGTCLVCPPHRLDREGICIEHLYEDKDLRRTVPGSQKRLRFKDEICFRSDRKTAFLTKISHVETVHIYDKDVAELAWQDGSDKGQLAISKRSFFEDVVLAEVNQQINFDGFKPTFELLTEILAHLEGDEVF